MEMRVAEIKAEVQVGLTNVSCSAKATVGVLRHRGQLCTAHRPLANAAEWPLQFRRMLTPDPK